MNEENPYKVQRDEVEDHCTICGNYNGHLPRCPNNKIEGRKDDGDKVRLDLIPSEFIFALGAILTSGAKKYDDRNWEKGMKWGRVFGALMRHLWAWWAGNGKTNEHFLFGSLDEETNYSHLWHAAACLCFLVTYELRNVGTDDRYKHSRTAERIRKVNKHESQNTGPFNDQDTDRSKK